MDKVTVREFSYNPSAMFARVEKGETIEVTRHGEVVAMLVPPQRGLRSRRDELIAAGELRPAARGLTTDRLDEYTRITVPDDADPLALLLELRADER